MVQYLENGDFKRKKRLGGGGMGTAYLAWQESLSRLVVLKFITGEMDDEARRRFRREAQLAAQFNHRNIVTIYGFEEDEIEGPYIVMEYVEGKSLDSYDIQDLMSVLDIASQITFALHTIHSAGVIHRDLKPSNVFLAKDSVEPIEPDRASSGFVAKIGDFGLAHHALKEQLTLSGIFLGSLPWAPPEQFGDASHVDETADLYALGVMLYQLLTNKQFPPTYEEALKLLRSEILENRYKAFEKLRDAKNLLPPPPSLYSSWSIPPQLDDLVLKLLQPHPQDRYQTAREVYRILLQLQTALQQLPETVQPQGSVVTPQDAVASSVSEAWPSLSPGQPISGIHLMQARTPERIRQLFAALGYATTSGTLSVDTLLGFGTKELGMVTEVQWLADYGDFQMFLIEMPDLSSARIRWVAETLLTHKMGDFFFVAVSPSKDQHGEAIYEQLVMVCPQRVRRPAMKGAKSPFKLLIKLNRLVIITASPSRHQLDILIEMTLPPAIMTGREVFEKIIAAFSIEALTKGFYKGYVNLYNSLLRSVRELQPDLVSSEGEQEIKGFVQRLLERILFLYFLQKKGWLADDPHFLTTCYDLCRKRKVEFYKGLLVPLLFDVLGRPAEERNQEMFAGSVWNESEIPSETEIPYLGGSLFEPDPKRQYEREITLPDKWFSPDVSGGVLKFFNSYDFTVEEDTPLDVAVSPDPEMLGKVFEELVTGRHESGSYYTPRPVVAFMCRETLKGYLRSRMPNEKPEALEQLIEERNTEDLLLRDRVLSTLMQVTVCDPACGSGAYLLGMLHELLDLRTALVTGTGQHVDTDQSMYSRKLEIIQYNLYGVDIDPLAVRTARMRLWLSLVVDFEGRHPPRLPDLDYKIMVGDSLLDTVNGESLITPGKFAGGGFQFGLFDELGMLRTEFTELLSEWVHHERSLHIESRMALKEQLLEKEQDLMLQILAQQKRELQNREQEVRSRPTKKTNRWGQVVEEKELDLIRIQIDVIEEMVRQIEKEGHRPLFLFPVYFPEVFTKSVHRPYIGFDIVLANPPYVRADAQFGYLSDERERQDAIIHWKKYRTVITETHTYQTLHEKWDLYIPFLERAYQLLCEHGHMVFIISDSYNSAKYASKSHTYFLKFACVERIDFCSELPLFEEVEVRNTILHFAKAFPSDTHAPSRFLHWGKTASSFDSEGNVKQLSTYPQFMGGEGIFRAQEMQKENEIQKNVLPLGKICYVSVGMVINANEKRAHGLFKAEDLVSERQDTDHPKPYVEGKDIARWRVQHIRYLEYGTKRAPAMFRRPTFPELHEARERLLALRVCDDSPVGAFDDQGLFSNHTAIIFIPWYLLAGIRNKSIKRTAKYRSEIKSRHEFRPDVNREELEELSRQFQAKYLLAVMNSNFCKQWLVKHRRGKFDIYPDDWKKLPIPAISLEQQMEFVQLVDAILAELGQPTVLLPTPVLAHVAELERAINQKVDALYGQLQEAVEQPEQEQLIEGGDDETELDKDEDYQE